MSLHDAVPCVVFAESGQPICGNGLVEAEEECDCGYSDQCKDPCCYSANEAEGKRCRLQPGKICRSVTTFWKSISSKMFLPNWFKNFFFFLICDCYAPVPAKGHVAQNHVRLKAQAKSADLTLTVPERACAMEPLLCVLPRNQRKTSPPAILIPKFASTGYVRIVPFLLYYI